MARLILIVIGVVYILNALVMWVAPLYWYETVPGIVEMGLYHAHLIRDVGLAYLVSGVGLIWALKNRDVGVFASIWPALHAIYHIAIFVGRGFPMDIISGTNLFLIQLPAWAALWAAWNLPRMSR